MRPRPGSALHSVDSTHGSVADLCYFICFIFVQNFSFNSDKSFGNPAFIVKLRQGSGKDRQGMALKAKGLKA